MEPENQPALQSTAISYEASKFLVEFNNAIYERNYDTMKRLYEQDFHRISENEYSDRRWPADFRVQSFYAETGNANEVVLSLYRELYFQHLFSRLCEDVCWNDRFLASCNYIRLLEYFVKIECSPTNTSPLALPELWLWDMISDFVYQYQQTQRWKFRYAAQISENRVAMESLHAGRQAWRANDVLAILSNLIEASQVKEWLQERQHTFTEHYTNQAATRAKPPIYLGYFAIIALMKLQVSLGNYRTALDIASPIELLPNALYWTVPACHITLYYNLGFAYMMMRRYQDALRVLSQIFIFVTKNRNYFTAPNYQQQVINKTIDKMYYLIMLCHALSPVKLDETIHNHIQEHWSDEYDKLQTGKEDVFRDVFTKACPKFFHPMISEYEDPEEHAKIDENEPLTRQINMFLKDVSFQKKVINVQSIAKLYNNLTLSKLAKLMGMEESNAVDFVQSEILSVKNRAEQVVWISGPFLSGKRKQILSDLDIYLEMDTIHVKNLTTQQNYVDGFIRQIQLTQDYLDFLTVNAASKMREIPALKS